MSKIIRSSEKVKTAHLSQINPEKRDQAANASGLFGHTNGRPSEAEIVDKAKEEARRLVAVAQAQSKEIEEEAHTKGYQSGLAIANKEVSDKLKLLEQVILSAREEKRKLIRAAETEIIDLSTKIAEKIIDEEIKVSPELVVSIAKKAIEAATDREHIIIRVNPADREMTRSHKAELLNSADGVKNIQVMVDQRIKRGGCVIETNSGNVDAQLTSQISHIEENLRGAIGGKQRQLN